MHEFSPPESAHALDVETLHHPDITFWPAWSDAALLGCGALKGLDATHGEIKSMRTASGHRRQGITRAMLHHILEEARVRLYVRVSVETRSQTQFYRRGVYKKTPASPTARRSEVRRRPSVFMTRSVSQDT